MSCARLATFLSRLSLGATERWSHALTGLALAACGATIRLGL